jgi:hypothetical protein
MRRSPADELKRLRQFRAPAPPDRSIAADVERLKKDLTKRRNAAGGLDTAIEQHAPPGLAPLIRVQRVTPGGIATLEAADAAASFELDQWLRSGGLEALRRACTVALRRVRVVTR